MNALANKIGRRLSRFHYVRSAIDDRADLSAFKARPDWRIFLGMFLIAFSFAMCWPVISVLGAWSIYYKRPWIFGIGAPTIYFLSHLCYLAGMALCGAKYSMIVFRWLTRVGVEKLLGAKSRPIAQASTVATDDPPATS